MAAAGGPGPALTDVPDEVLVASLAELAYTDLARVACSISRFAKLASYPQLWRTLFLSRWAAVPPKPSNLFEEAAVLAGSWLALYRSKHQMEATSNGWNRPCEFELRATLERLATRAAAAAKHPEDELIFLGAAAADSKSPAACAATSSSSCGGPPASPTSFLSACAALSPTPSASLHRMSTASTASASTSAAAAAAAFGGSPATIFVAGGSGSSSVPSPFLNSHNQQHFAGATAAGAMLVDAGGVGETAPAPGAAAPLSPPPREVHLVFLLDGSGSVSEEDFSEMKRFVSVSTPMLCAALGVGAQGKVAVVQFSTEPRVEVPLAAMEGAALATALDAMVRMNGGTNISTAIARAGALLKAEDQALAGGGAAAADGAGAPEDEDAPPLPDAAALEAPPLPPASPAHAHMLAPMAVDEIEAAEMAGAQPGSGSQASGCADGAPRLRPVRLVLLLTDGRVDTYQAREARSTACRLADELWGCTLAAFGVGRGVDRAELLHIIDTPSGDASSRYLDLFTRDDAPW